MNDFKWCHHQGEIILGCVRWYCKYGISYRDLEEIMSERGIEVDHVTLYRWVIQYTLELEKRLRWNGKLGLGYSWREDETYVTVKGKWAYLYRAIDKRGCTIDFYLSSTRNATDKAPSYAVC
jgi:IS6 family transposase